MILLSMISKTKIAKYALLPGLKSRFGALFTSGFQHIPFFIALVYQTVKLLPENHPYTQARNIGKFGIRHVIAEAANNLIINKNNIDQIVLFLSILIGLALILVQICLLGIGLLWQPAMALGFVEMFITLEPAQDVAGMMMDLVFGVPDIFNSCISTSVDCINLHGQTMGADATSLTSGPFTPGQPFPSPMHHGLHQMFAIYSYGLLIVAVMITMYFITAVLAETAQTGTPFGKRYNKVWAPIRIAVAFGLLVPIGNNGLNASQYIVLHAAKLGSSFATNGWNEFNLTLGNAFLGDVKNLVSQPNAPDITPLVEFFFLANTCYYVEKIWNGWTKEEGIKPYLVKSAGLFGNTSKFILRDTTYKEALEFTQDGTDGPAASILRIRFGKQEEHKNSGKDGYVASTCGEVTLKLSDPRIPGSGDGKEPEPAMLLLQEYYWFMIKELWYEDTLSNLTGTIYPREYARTGARENDSEAYEPPAQYRSFLKKYYEYSMKYVLTGVEPQDTELSLGDWERPFDVPAGGVVGLMANSSQWDVPDTLLQRGWGGAGIWYNRIAEMNGAVTDSVFNIPSPTKWPAIMEWVKVKKEQYNQDTDILNLFKPELAKGLDIHFENGSKDQGKATIYNDAYSFWKADGGLTTSQDQLTGNIMIDTINLLLGTDGLYSMRKNENVHPLAQLVGVGKSLVTSSIRNVGWAGAGTLAAMLSGHGEGVAKTLTGFMVTLATIGLTMGFILYYIVPFLPFLYFFFALGGWVKGIFEAMVGAPLWALAHIRIDGEGLSGSAAVNGYFLIFEIFLRPILTIFGMIASITIFGALVSVLNQTFDMVTANLGGFDAGCEADLSACAPDGGATFTQIEFYRGPVDEFFFTVIYTLVVYTMGLSSFKLIDQIPNNIFRWMGQSLASFNDSREDPTSKMISSANVGAQQGLRGLGGGIKSFLGGG